MDYRYQDGKMKRDDTKRDSFTTYEPKKTFRWILTPPDDSLAEFAPYLVKSVKLTDDLLEITMHSPLHGPSPIDQLRNMRSILVKWISSTGEVASTRRIDWLPGDASYSFLDLDYGCSGPMYEVFKVVRPTVHPEKSTVK